MAIKLYREPELRNPVMFCGWPGIGNIGIAAIDTLRGILRAQEFGEIEPWDFFQPQKVVIKNGLLKDLAFPKNRFWFRRIKGRDLIFFIGEEQAFEGETRYAQGRKAYQLANLVLDVGEKFGCRRVYTSGAAVARIHHTTKPRVWAAPNSQNLIEEVKKYGNTVLMSEIEGRGGQGAISGLNGLLLGVAKKRGLEAICLMGEIPYYLQRALWFYPKASKSVLEVLTEILGFRIDLSSLDELVKKAEREIEQSLERLYNLEDASPPVVQLREQIELLRQQRPAKLGPITEEEQEEMVGHLDEFFDEIKEGGGENEKSL